MTSRDDATAYVASNGVVNVSDLPQDIAKAMGVDMERLKKRKKRKKDKEEKDRNGVTARASRSSSDVRMKMRKTFQIPRTKS